MNPIPVDLMSTNVYSFAGHVLVSGTCLHQVAPQALQTLAAQSDQIAFVCLESTHVNMVITKLSAILSTGRVTGMTFASVDRSPHCTQLHYIQHELERVMPVHVPMTHFVCEGEKVTSIPIQTIELSKSLARLTALCQA